MPSEHVMTVAGPIAPERLGRTLVHEHLHMDATPLLAVHAYTPNETPMTIANAAEARWNPGAFADNYRHTDVDLVVRELEPFVKAGGRTIVDTTPVGLSRAPAKLLDIATRSGVQVVMGCGYYLEPCHPPESATRSADDLAAELIDEICNGVDGTGIKPGIIGEIGTFTPVTAREIKALRAACRAQRATGLPLTIHMHPWAKEGDVVARVVIAEEALDPSRVLLNHQNTAIDDEPYLRRLLDQGLNLAFDLFGFDHSLIGLGRYPPSDLDVAHTVARLAKAGYLDRLFISHDIGVRTRLLAYGGWGYAHVLTHVVPLLKGDGLSDEKIDAMLVTNPRRLLTIQSR